MITAVSIGLYLVAALLAAITGVHAEQHKNGADVNTNGRVSIISFAIAFLMAVALQVAA